MPINDHLTMRSMDIVYLFRTQRVARSDTLLTFSCVKSIKVARVGSERTLTTTFRGLLKIVHPLATLNVTLIYRSTRIMVLGAILALCLLTPSIVSSQFPTVCNTRESLQSKTCCPNECGGPTRGTCRNISSVAATQAQTADQAVINILQAAPEEPQKGTADSRYLWPTVVFERDSLRSLDPKYITCADARAAHCKRSVVGRNRSTWVQVRVLQLCGHMRISHSAWVQGGQYPMRAREL